MKITIEIDTNTKRATVTDDHAQQRVEYGCEAFEWRNEMHDPRHPNGLINPLMINEATGRHFVNMTLLKLRVLQ